VAILGCSVLEGGGPGQSCWCRPLQTVRRVGGRWAIVGSAHPAGLAGLKEK
jgi:hypothetical protein